jgi:hypothetical protein
MPERKVVFMVWNVGILVVGSLYWDPNREGWRGRRLTSDDGVLVQAPIRYGRKSRSRKDTYTMVFAPRLSAASYGTARILRCQGPISSSEELIAEAKQLWIAENPRTGNRPQTAQRFQRIGAALHCSHTRDFSRGRT